MSHQVSISRAAQLLGVARGILQQRLRDSGLAPDDGWVSTELLSRLYPGAKLEETGLLERVGKIRDESFGKRVRERLLPNQEVLAQRLLAQSQELADVHQHLRRYHKLVIGLQKEVRQQLSHHPDDANWLELEQHVTQGLAQALATVSVDMLEVMDDMLKVITAQVTVRPGGHEFAVEGHANLLQAGLHSGLKLNYGCNDGSCGMCKVRVISGEVARIQSFDYALSETEKAQGYTLMCCHTAASSELTLEALEANGPQDIPEQHISTRVHSSTVLASDTRQLHLQTPRNHRLRFLAGQSVQLGWTMTGQDDVHAVYPIASCPCDDHNLLFFICRDDSDEFARRLFAGDIQAGAIVTVLGPSGEFVLADGHRPLVFAACDGGFGPVKSLIEHALSLDDAPSLSLYWLATRQDGHFFSNQCRAWSEALDQFEYELVTQADASLGAWQIAQGMRADLFDIDCDFYLAGPAEFIRTLHTELRSSGVAAAQIFTLVLGLA